MQELLGTLAVLGPKLEFVAVDLAALPAGEKGEVAKITKELVLAAQQLPGGGPRIFLRPFRDWKRRNWATPPTFALLPKASGKLARSFCEPRGRLATSSMYGFEDSLVQGSAAGNSGSC